MTKNKGNYRRLLAFTGLAGILALAASHDALAQKALNIKAGQVRVLKIPNIERVAVGDGKIINAVADDPNEVVLFARQAGETSLQIWDQTGKSRSYQIQVNSAAQKRTQDDIRRIVAKIPNVTATVVGNKIIVEGDQLTDSDRNRLKLLMKHYPQIVNMTSQVGWDQMVMLDVQVLEIPKNFLREFGVNWQSTSQGGINLGMVWDSRGKGYQSRPGEAVLDATFPAYHPLPYMGMNALLESNIKLMVNDGKAVMLAQPQLMARSGATADFLAGGEIPYSVTDNNGNAQTMFKPYGVALQITPRIERNGIVRSKISVEVSSVDGSMVYEGGPALKIRRTSTEFNVRSGETLVLSGFISREQLNGASKVPGFGDIPIIGALFRSEKFQKNETELAIFVRPVLVSAQDPDHLQRVNNSQQLISQTFDQPLMLNTPIANHSEQIVLQEPFFQFTHREPGIEHPTEDTSHSPLKADLNSAKQPPEYLQLKQPKVDFLLFSESIDTTHKSSEGLR